MRKRTLENPRLGNCRFTVTRAYPSMPDFLSLPFRERLAWRLRYFADKLDRGLSYRLTGSVPAGMGDQDVFDAMCFGFTGMQAYMADLSLERRTE